MLPSVNISLAMWIAKSDTVLYVALQKGNKYFLQSVGYAFSNATQYAIVFLMVGLIVLLKLRSLRGYGLVKAESL